MISNKNSVFLLSLSHTHAHASTVCLFLFHLKTTCRHSTRHSSNPYHFHSFVIPPQTFNDFRTFESVVLLNNCNTLSLSRSDVHENLVFDEYQRKMTRTNIVASLSFTLIMKIDYFFYLTTPVHCIEREKGEGGTRGEEEKKKRVNM